jgi:hypothetical protein
MSVAGTAPFGAGGVHLAIVGKTAEDGLTYSVAGCAGSGGILRGSTRVIRGCRHDIVFGGRGVVWAGGFAIGGLGPFWFGGLIHFDLWRYYCASSVLSS